MSNQQARAAINAVIENLERFHPAPYRWRSKVSVRRESEGLLSSMTDSVDSFQLATQLEMLVGSLDDDATRLVTYVRPANFDVTMGADGAFFPAVIGAVNGGLVVLKGTQGLRAGDRLLRVSGYDMDSLVRALAAHAPGKAPRAPERIASWLFFSPKNPGFAMPFELEVQGADGDVRRFVAPGLSLSEMWPAWVDSADRHQSGRAFRTRQIGEVIVLTPQLDGADARVIREQLATVIRSLEQSPASSLVVDARGVSYMSGEFAQQLREQLTGSGKLARRRTPACLLIDKETADHAAMLVDQLSMEPSVRAIGEETAWRRNSYVSDGGVVTIPHIFSRLFLPAEKQPRGAGTNDAEHGVVPHVRRVRTVRDVAEGRDPVFALGLGCAALVANALGSVARPH